MNHTRLWTSAGIIAAVIIVSFMLSVPHTRDVPRSPGPEKQVPIVSAVTIHDVFKKGSHAITGSLMAPNACTIATAMATLVGSASSTQSILVAINMPIDTGMCLQEPTRINFSTTISAGAKLPIRATVNGLSATTTAS